jgi:LysR family nitrogen assimilation transcriptional regulator
MVSSRLLFYFVRVAELGSLTKASLGLEISQSVLSRHIRALETALGYRVFHRTGRGIALTDAGQALLPGARDLLARSAQFAEEAKALGGSPSGTVVLGMPGSIASMLAGPVYRMASEKYPRIRLRLVEGLSGVIDELLTLGRIDIGLRYNDSGKRSAGETPLCTVDLYLVGPPRDPLTSGGEVRLKSVDGRPFFLPSAPHALRRLMEDLFMRYRMRLVVPFEVDSLSTMTNVVAAGGGYTVAPRSAVARYEDAGTVQLARITHPTISRMLVMSLPVKGALTSATRVTAGLITDLVRDLVDDGQLGRIGAGALMKRTQRSTGAKG